MSYSKYSNKVESFLAWITFTRGKKHTRLWQSAIYRNPKKYKKLALYFYKKLGY